jgi:alanyl-tRNA synthetase
VTERLFHGPPLQSDADADFHAVVVSAASQGDDQTAVTLDRTRFYPNSGGQPCDLGTLNGVAVVDVIEDGEEIVHLLKGTDAAAWTVDQEVHGRIDPSRRRDHMQQHSAQHVLSAILLARFEIPTLSFHLGAEASTIDVKAELLGDAQLSELEAEMGAVIRACQPVVATVYEGEAIAAAAQGLRKAPAPEILASPRGLRIVQFGDDAHPLDRDPCCGTHVSSTGQLGSFVILGTERGRKGETRISFAAGARATQAIRTRLAALNAAGAVLTSGFPDLAERGQKLLDRVKELKRELKQTSGRLVEFEAAAAAASASSVLVHELDGDDPKLAGAFARACVTANPKLLVAVIHAGERLTLAIARGAEAPEIHSGNTVRELLQPFDGKGGGAPHSAQGAAPDPARSEELRDAVGLALEAASG